MISINEWMLKKPHYNIQSLKHMHVVSRSPKKIGRIHNSPIHRLPQPQRNSIQIQRLQNYNQVPKKRSTHRVQNYYDPQHGHYNASIQIDSSYPQSKGQYIIVEPVRKSREFATKGSTPRMTVERRFRPDQSYEDSEYVIVKKKIRKPQQIVQYSDEQQFQENYNDYDSHPIEKISILSKEHTSPKSSKEEKLGLRRVARQKLPKVSVEEQDGTRYVVPSNVNYVQNQRHSYKRSQLGPMPASQLSPHRHRRLATTVEQYDDEYSKTQTEEEVENCEVVQQPDYEEEDEYASDDEESYEEVIYYKPKPSAFLKQKPHNAIKKEIEARFKDIEQILQTQNDNLKEHNQYLLAVIKKMQSKDRKQRNLLSSQQIQIKKLTEEKDAYMERCYHLQNVMAMNNQMFKQEERQIQKQCSVLNFDNTGHSKQTSTASDAINDTVQMKPQSKEEIDDLRKYLKTTIPTQNERKRPTHIPIPIEQPNTSLHNATPEFYSNNESSPERRPRLTAKISNTSQNSDPSSTIFNDNSGIMNESSFGAGWINTNSGFSIVNGLKNQMKTEGIQDMSDIYEEEELKMREEGLEGDDEKTAKNSNNQSKMIRYTTKGDEEAVEELNAKFEQLMQEYRVNHDVKIRKQCVEIAKKIKQLKQQIQKNQESNEEGQAKIVDQTDSMLLQQDKGMKVTRVKSGHTRSNNITGQVVNKVKSN